MDDFERELGGDLLASVSRSFYLSLKILPSEIRGAASLGYLLARATDTVADTDAVASGERLQVLSGMAAAVAGEAPVPDFTELLGERSPGGTENVELAILRRFSSWLAFFEHMPSWQVEAIQRVVASVIKGQTDDLQRFSGDHPVVLGSVGELEQYTYDVAGCVGVFWTDLGYGAYGDSYSSLQRGEMEELGKDYGKGLQLINILRDFPEDLASGRCYIPGVDPESGGRKIWEEDAAFWRERCRELLSSAGKYINAVNPRRLRLATALPALIGAKTLKLLGSAGWEELQQRVKVERKEVKRLLRKGFFGSFRRQGLGKLFAELLDDYPG
ncbi:MAG: squalene/phytoene synthase family protein [Verrucomicrobiaceae bacterium]|nr:squalene/phytoene synthase family protein [Verrucomicrobiaceae bacterium]